MPPRLPDQKRTAIADDIRDGGTCRGIAKKHGISAATVAAIAKEHGLGGAFERTQTEAATRAKTADNRARRAALSSGLLEDAEKLRARAWEPYTHYVAGKAGAERVTLDLPPLGEVRNAYAALGIATDKHVALERIDSDSGAGAAASMLGGIADALSAAAEAMEQDASGDTEA